ncbi:MAG: TetR/AcrR family transcriptional regulator [Gammaproteobacteria bacterium]|nr:TetR/AcrR family transcriptional regulator [Gammaproteobacteria bacterium]
MPWDKQFDPAEVLTKAMQAFWMRGYEATSIQDLVDFTAVNRASLYATFGDKRALFLAALQRYDAQRQARLAELERRYPPREAVRRLFLGFIEQAITDAAPRGCFLTNTAVELAAHDPEIANAVARSQMELEAFFRRMVESARNRGEVAGGTDATQAARGLLASLLGLLVLAHSRPRKALLQSIADEALARLE